MGVQVVNNIMAYLYVGNKGDVNLSSLSISHLSLSLSPLSPLSLSPATPLSLRLSLCSSLSLSHSLSLSVMKDQCVSAARVSLSLRFTCQVQIGGPILPPHEHLE